MVGGQSGTMQRGEQPLVTLTKSHPADSLLLTQLHSPLNSPMKTDRRPKNQITADGRHNLMARTIQLKSATTRPRTQMTSSGAHRGKGSRAAMKTLTSAGGGPETLPAKTSGNAAD